MIDAFLTYLKVEKRASPNTVAAYRRDIECFVQYYDDQEGVFDPQKVTHTDLRGWIMASIERGDANTTVNRRLSAMKSMYRYLLKHEMVVSDPTVKLHSLKKRRRLPVFVEKSKIVRHGELLVGETDDDETMRKQMIVLLFYATGIRLAELVGIDVEDVSLEESEMKVTGKGEKQRIVPLPVVVADKLRKYINYRQNICNCQNKALFLTNKNKRISRTEVYRTVSEVLAAMGVQGKRSPHVLRHTFATHLLNEGVGIETVKELLGHINLSTTQIYTHNTIEELKRSYLKAHPFAKKY